MAKQGRREGFKGAKENNRKATGAHEAWLKRKKARNASRVIVHIDGIAKVITTYPAQS